ncbi:MAG: GNAT family N-acetyltransferase, partial [Ktedonobacteraceae bacterium]
PPHHCTIHMQTIEGKCLSDEVKQGLMKKQTWREAELAQVDELLETCNTYEGLCVKLAMVMLRTRSGHESNDFLYYVEGKLVGLLALDNMGTEEKEVTVAVHPDYRRRGIATALLAAARKEAQQRGIERFILVCERFSRSGLAFVAALGAEYDYSEHKMVLTEPHTRLDYSEQITLRKASPADVEIVAHIIATCFGQTREGAIRHVAESMHEPYNQYYVAKLAGEAVGCLNLFIDDKEYGIYAFAVLPQYRRRGFGRQMLEQIIQDIRSNNQGAQKRIALEVESENKHAIHLYRSCGFQEITSYGYYNFDLG